VNRTSTRGPRRPPVERLRAELAERAGPVVAAQLPNGYARVGRVLLVRWPESLRPHFAFLAASLADRLGAATVLRPTGPVEGELRTPQVELLFGSETETEVVEHGVRWRFDAARVLFATGNQTERARAGHVVRPGETVVDLFAGIGYFAIPAARIGHASRVVAVDRNPVSIHYLRENARLNGVADVVEGVEGDNRNVALPAGTADRVFLGYLPSAVPWVAQAVSLLRPEGGTLHVHTVTNARWAVREGVAAVAEAARQGGGAVEGIPAGRAVKPYGPGRTHVVVDLRVRPR
jgi:tRNA wybutosine-synthesizing protein 2